MNKQEIRKVVNQEFGFDMKKIVLLEASKNSFGKYDYIMFDVCGIEYQMSYLYLEQRYVLHIYKCNGIVTVGE